MTDIIIFSGQSNMQGETESRPIEQPVKNAYEYLMQSDYLEPLNHPVGERLGYDENHCSKVLLDEAEKKRGSLVPYFCKEYLKKREKVVAIHAALGSTVIDK